MELKPDALPSLITRRTKAIILVSPSNPTGAIFGRKQLLETGAIVKDHGLLLIIDDPYSKFAYENSERFFDLAGEPWLADNLAYLFTFSKCYAMSGWRLGYMIVPECLKQQALKVHDATIICTPRVSQVAGLAALTGGNDHLRQFCDTLASRRRLICERLDRLPQVFEYRKPQGAYYVFPRILIEHENAYQFVIDLLESTGVAVTPGSAFGPGGEHHVRMAFCVDEDDIVCAFDRMEQYCDC